MRYISQSEVFCRLWTKSMVTKLLGPPDHIETTKNGHPKYLYSLDKVIAAEQTPEYTALLHNWHKKSYLCHSCHDPDDASADLTYWKQWTTISLYRVHFGCNPPKSLSIPEKPRNPFFYTSATSSTYRLDPAVDPEPLPSTPEITPDPQNNLSKTEVDTIYNSLPRFDNKYIAPEDLETRGWSKIKINKLLGPPTYPFFMDYKYTIKSYYLLKDVLAAETAPEFKSLAGK